MMLGHALALTAGGRRDNTVRLAAPTGLLVTEDDAAGEIDATWDAVVGASGYAYNIGAGWVDNLTATSVADLAVGYAPGYFRVRAYDAATGLAAVAAYDLEEPVGATAGLREDGGTALREDGTTTEREG